MKISIKIMILMVVSFLTMATQCEDDNAEWRYLSVENRSDEPIIFTNSYIRDLDVDLFLDGKFGRKMIVLPDQIVRDTILRRNATRYKDDSIYTYIFKQSTIERNTFEELKANGYDKVFRMRFEDYDAIDHKVVYE